MKEETATDNQVEVYMDRVLNRNMKKFRYIIQNPFNKNKRKKNIYLDWIEYFEENYDTTFMYCRTKDFPRKAIEYCQTKMDELEE